MLKIPLTKPELGEEESRLIQETLLSGWITQGPRVAEFESEFASFVGAKHAVAVSSCTTALHLALLILGIKPGDEVIVTPHSFIASANAVLYCGAIPVFVDIERDTLNIDPQLICSAISKKTKAILVVHQVGRPANLQAIKKIAVENKIAIIEDAACAIGSEYRGVKIGNNDYSDLVCFSFHPRKVVTTGDGGMITTDNSAYCEQLKLLRQHGMSLTDLQRHNSNLIATETYCQLGYNYRLTDLQAALGLAQLRRLPAILARRREIAAAYDREFENHPKISIFREPDDSVWNQQSYLIRLSSVDVVARNAVMQGLLDLGIATRRGIMSIHREPCYVTRFGAQHFEESESASDQCICLPIFPSLTHSEQRYVIDSLLSLLQTM